MVNLGFRNKKEEKKVNGIHKSWINLRWNNLMQFLLTVKLK